MSNCEARVDVQHHFFSVKNRKKQKAAYTASKITNGILNIGTNASGYTTPHRRAFPRQTTPRASAMFLKVLAPKRPLHQQTYLSVRESQESRIEDWSK